MNGMVSVEVVLANRDSVFTGEMWNIPRIGEAVRVHNTLLRITDVVWEFSPLIKHGAKVTLTVRKPPSDTN